MPVILTSDFPPAVGGIQRYIERVADGLALRGHHVIVVAPATSGADGSTRRYDVRRFRIGGRVETLFAMSKALADAERLVDDGIVLASSWYPAGIVAVRRTARARRRVAIMAYGSEIVRQEGALRRVVMRTVFENADVVVSISRFTSALLREAGIERAPILAGCGVDPGSISPKPGFVPMILSVGRLVRRKGYDSVIRALPVLRKRFPSLHYEIVGDGPDRAYLEDLAKSLSVDDAVIFCGAVADECVRSAYERAWCFALPVRREPHDVEGFGLVYLEAATARLAAVGGRYSGAEDAIEDGVTGLLVDGRRQDEVTHALDVLLRDRDFADRLGGAAWRRASRDFSWDGVVRTIERGVGLD